ncbi:MAG: hypothetical protein GEU86_09520 [Actinophytocola sp.]|nr:hypothetical protein [Actinophytocola sp.]
MNAKSITGWLAAIGVPNEVVSVGSEADNTWCLLRTEQVRPASATDAEADARGAEDDDTATETVLAWEVFWREQGNRYDWASFTNEVVACHYLFGRLAWSQVARGAVGLLPEAQPAPPAS